MTRLAEWLGNKADRLVVDRTGLSGTYDFELQFTRDGAVGEAISRPVRRRCSRRSVNSWA